MDCCYNKEMNQDLKHGLYVLLSSYLVKNTLINKKGKKKRKKLPENHLIKKV